MHIKRRVPMYFVSIIAIVFVTAILTFSVSIQSFIDLPSLLLVLLLAVPILISSGLFRDFNNAFQPD